MLVSWCCKDLEGNRLFGPKAVSQDKGQHDLGFLELGNFTQEFPEKWLLCLNGSNKPLIYIWFFCLFTSSQDLEDPQVFHF